MFEQTESSGISSEHAIQRMFELVSEGRTDSSEYALLDAVIQSRLRQTYDGSEPVGYDDPTPAVAEELPPLQSAA